MTFLPTQNKIYIFIYGKHHIQVIQEFLNDSPKLEKSSMETSIEYSIKYENIAIMQCWKVAGALHSPNGILLKAKVT